VYNEGIPASDFDEPLRVPPSSIVTNTERTFAIRVRDGDAEHVDVAGEAVQSRVEVSGPLPAGNEIVRRAGNETRDGANWAAQRAAREAISRRW